jgi:hypothetical protein
LIYKVRWRAFGSSQPKLTFVDTITPEAAKAMVERLNSDFSRFDQILQVQTVTGEVVLRCNVASFPDAVDSGRSLQGAA